MTIYFYINIFFLCTLYTFSCLCAGTVLMNLFARFSGPIKNISPLNFVLTSFLLGSGVLANIWAMLLSVSLLYQISVWVVLVISIAAGFKNIWQIRSLLFNRVQAIKRDFAEESRSWKTIIILTLIMIILTGIRSFAPLSYYCDASAFYMVLPKLLAGTHKWSLLGGYESFSTIGLHGELHYAALMTLGSDWGAKLFNWPIGLSCAGVLAALSRELGVGRRGQWLVVCMIFSSTAFNKLIGSGKVDIYAAAMGVAAVYWVFQGCNKENSSTGSDFLLPGLFAGFAVVAKISYLPLIIPCLILMIIWKNYYPGTGRSFRLNNVTFAIVLLGVGMLLPILIHFLKNWILFSEPFAPFFYLSKSHIAGNIASQKWIAGDTVKKLILTYPLALTYGDYPFQMGTMSKLYLAFSPLLLLMPRKKNLLGSGMFQITIAGMAGIIIWTILKPEVFAPRYILYTLLLLTPVIAGAAEYITVQKEKNRYLSVSIICACILCLLFANLSYAHRMKRRIRKKSTFSSSVYLASKKMNGIAGIKDRVYSLNYFTYWYKSDLLKSMSHIHEKVLFDPGNSVKTWESLYKNGFRFVFINRLTLKTIAEQLNPDLKPDELNIETIFNSGDILVYHLTAGNQHE